MRALGSRIVLEGRRIPTERVGQLRVPRLGRQRVGSGVRVGAWGGVDARWNPLLEVGHHHLGEGLELLLGTLGSDLAPVHLGQVRFLSGVLYGTPGTNRSPIASL
jgi:hypothetical protein